MGTEIPAEIKLPESSIDNSSKEIWTSESSKPMEHDESGFNSNVIFFQGIKYDWETDYKPRKP
jgi:hypothetical protein